MRRTLPPNLLGQKVSRFMQAQDGTAAVEFGLVGLPFISVIAVAFQCAFMLWASQNLDMMLDRAVRNLMTGSFQAANSGTTDTATLLGNLRTVMCGTGASAVPTVFSCSNLKLNVTTSSSFSGSSAATSYDSSKKAVSSSFESYTCPAAGAITIVTAAVPLSAFFSGLLPQFSMLSDGSYLLRSTAVFRTEPYTTSGC